MTAPRPYSPDTLAKRWGVSAMTVRNMCQDGTLPHFRLGKLYRITAQAVEEYECQTSPSDGSEGDIVSHGARAGSENAISLKHATPRKQRRKQ